MNLKFHHRSYIENYIIPRKISTHRISITIPHFSPAIRFITLHLRNPAERFHFLALSAQVRVNSSAVLLTGLPRSTISPALSFSPPFLRRARAHIIYITRFIHPSRPSSSSFSYSNTGACTLHHLSSFFSFPGCALYNVVVTAYNM